MKHLPKLIASLFVCYFVAYAGSIVTTPAIPTWYASLEKPFFNPPNWVFGPVWTILYTLMAISLFLIWKHPHEKTAKNKALTSFFIQLTLNYLWSAVFFGLHQPLLGLAVILVLWAYIKQTIDRFSPLSKTASNLLYPYLAWVSFATVLNFAIAVLNF